MESAASSCPPARSGSGDCEGVGCASSHNVWPLHQVRHNGGVRRLCSSCVLLGHRGSFCSVCILFVFPDATFQEGYYDPIVACSRCPAVAHLSCIPNPSYFVCPPCAAAAEGRAFSYAPTGGAPHAVDERASRVLFVAAHFAHESVARAATAAREEAERLVRDAAAARKRARLMLDVAFRAMEAEAKEQSAAAASRALKVEAMDAKEQSAATTTLLAARAAPAAPEPPMKKTPKSNEANRASDNFLKIKSMQQPALAYAAAAAAAAASSMPSSTPSSGDEKKPIKQGRGSSNRGAKDDRMTLFGAFRS